MNSHDRPLTGRAALVTGVSRRRGIGYGIATRLAELGASVFVQHFTAHDAALPWGSDDLTAVFDGIRAAQAPDARFGEANADMTDPATPARLIEQAAEALGRLDILVCNHARSGGDGSILDMTAERLDGHWQVNARSTLMLTRHFTEQFAGVRPDPDGTQPGVRQQSSGPHDEFHTGRVFWMTSGQIHGAMVGEVAYASSKAALAGITPTVANELLAHGIVLNTINPGPVNTGYLDPETTDRPVEQNERVLASLPFGRFGEPADPARLIGWLCTDDGRWIVGQVLTSDGGFSL